MITSPLRSSTDGRKIKHPKKSKRKVLKGKSKKKLAKSKKRRRSFKHIRKPHDGGFTVETPIIPFNTCKVFKAL